MFFRGTRGSYLWAIAASVCWLCLSAAVAEENESPRGVSVDAASRLILAGETLSHAASHPRVGQARVSLDIAFLFDELEGLATRTDTPKGHAACGQGRISWEQLVTPQCLAALLVSERREGRLASEIAAQAFLKARQQLFRLTARPQFLRPFRPPSFNGDAASSSVQGKLAEWWRRYGLTGLEAIVRIGHESIQHRETDDSDQHTLRIMRALRQVLRETAVTYLASVVQDPKAGHGLEKFAEPFEDLLDQSAKARDRLGAAERIAMLYDERLAAEMHKVVGNLSARHCRKLVRDDLHTSLQPTQDECKAAIGQIQRIAKDGKPVEIVQTLTATLDERAVTLRFLLSKLTRIEKASTCGGAVAAMRQVMTPAREDLDASRLEEMAAHLARLVELCRPQVTIAFEETATQWLRHLCRDTRNRGTSAARSPGAGSPEEVEEVWSIQQPEVRVELCGTPAENIFSDLPADRKPGSPSAGAAEALEELKSVAFESLRSLEFSALRPILDTIRVPYETDGTVRHVEILRTLCRLSPPDGDDGIEARVVSALFRDLELAGEAHLEALRESLCKLLRGPAKVATADALIDEMALPTIGDGDAAEAAGSTLHATLTRTVNLVGDLSDEIAHRVSAVGRVVRFARDAEVLVPLGPGDSGCAGNARGRGLGAGLKISALDPRLDHSDPERWTATLTGSATLVVCGANGAQGMRRVVSIHDLSSDVTLTLDLDDRDITTTEDAAPRQWSTALNKEIDEAYRRITIIDDALRSELVMKLPALLQAAGIDLAALVIVKSALPDQPDRLDVRYHTDTGILFTIEVPLKLEEMLAGPDRVRICVAIPLSASPSASDNGCRPAREVRAAADQLVKAVFSPMLEQFVRKTGRDLNLAEPRIEDLVSAVFSRPTGAGNEDGSFLKGYFGVGLSAGENGESTRELHLRIPASVVIEELQKAGMVAAGSRDPPLTGDLEVSLWPDPSGALVLGKASMPSLNPRYLLARILPEGSLDNGFLSVSPAAVQGADEPCSNKPMLRLALGPGASLAGTLGFVCLVREQGRLSARFVPDKEGSLSSRDGNWVFSYRNSEHGGPVGTPTLTLKMKATSDDPRIQRFSEEWVTVRFDLATGSWELPADGDHNREIYGRIEQGANDLLPPGVRVRHVRIGSKGVEVSFDRAMAAGSVGQLAWHALSDGRIAALKADRERDCDLEKIHWLSQLVYQGEVPEPLRHSACDNPPGLQDRAEPMQGLPVEWTCDAESDSPHARVDECAIEFPKELSFCSSPLRLQVEWEKRDPVLRADKAGECLKSRIDGLLPDTLAGSVNLENPTFRLVGECSRDPQGESQSCGIATDIQVDISPLTDDLETAVADLSKHLGAGSESCAFDEAMNLSLRGVMTFEGALRLESGGRALLEGAETNLRRCTQALTGAAARAATREFARRMKDAVKTDEIFEIAAMAARNSLKGLRKALNVGSDGEAATCRLRLREGADLDCHKLMASHLEEETVTGVRFTRTVEMADLAFTLRLDSGWKTPSVGDIVDPAELSDAEDPGQALHSAFEDAFEDWFEEFDPRVTVGCKVVVEDAGCLESLSAEIKKVVGSVGGGMVSYEDGASLTSRGKKFTLRVPLRVTVPVLESESQVSLTCTLDATQWWQPTIGTCGADTNLESLLVGILTDELGKRLEGESFDLGPLSYKVTEVEPETTSADKFRIEGVASLSAIKIAELQELDLRIVFNDEWSPRVEADLKQFTDSLTGDLKKAVNKVIGGAIPLKIETITVADASDLGVPTAFGIESTADIAGLFSISAPRLVLSRSGFRIEGPNRLAISFPEGMTIPVSPFAICPTGGGLEDTELTVTANITLAECTASHLLKYQGQLAIKLDNPGRVETDGSLTLLGLIPLGSNRGELDLSRPMMSMDAEIGGVAKDIVEATGKFVISGDPILAKADADVALFRVPVGKGHFKLDLTTGELDMAVRADLGFARGQGHVGTQHRFSSPRAKIDTRMNIGGFPVFAGDIEARPRLARVGLTVFGIRFGAAVPGLEALSASAILELLTRFLNLGFEDLERALEAMLSGNFEMNPFAEFGSGGDGLGGDDDGTLGESGHEKPGDGDTEGTDEAPKVDGDSPDPGRPLPETGEVEGGPLNQAAMPLWFQRSKEADRVHIGVGIKGTPDERLVAVARYDPHHFGPDGVRLGLTMTVHDYGYSQILSREIAGSGDCLAGPGDVAYLYRGKDVPRQGYYELCRVAGPDGRHLTVERLAELDAETRVDLAVLNGALLAELAERSLLSSEDRMLRKGRLLTAKNGSLRGGVAFQRPGELLIVMRGKFTDEGNTCGTAATVDSSDDSKTWSDPRIFWITGLGERDLGDDELILQTVAALWGCPQGALARVDREIGLLTTGGIVSVRGPESVGFSKIAEIVPREDRVPQWVGEFSNDLREAIERTKRENQRSLEQTALKDALEKEKRSRGAEGAILCIEDCAPAPRIDMRPDDGVCKIWVDDKPSAEVPPDVYGGDRCELSADHTWLTIVPGEYLTAITHGLATDSTTDLRIGAFGPDTSQSGLTDGLTGIAQDGLSIDEYHLIRGFLQHAVTSKWSSSQLQTTRFARHPAGSLALVAELSGDPLTFHWHVRSNADTRYFKQTGLELSDKQRSALLPLLIATPERAEALNTEEGDTTLWLGFERHLRLYTWNGESGSWAMLLELNRFDDPLSDAYEDVVREDIMKRLRNGLDRNGGPYHATLFPHVGGSSHWGYALWSSHSATATLSFKPVHREDPPRSGTLTEAGDRLEVTGGDMTEWFDISVPAEMRGIVLARNLAHETKWDQVLCLFTPSGELIDCDDDDGKNVDGDNPRASLIAIPSSSKEQRFVTAVRNYYVRKPTPPFAIELLNWSASLPDRVSEPCAAPIRTFMCQPLVKQTVRPEEGDFQRFDVPGIGLARTDTAFLRSLARTIDSNREPPGSYSVFASRDSVHAAWQTPDEAKLRLMSMAEGGTLSTLADFKADGETTHLPPGHAWPRLADILHHRSHPALRLEGSNLDLPAELGSEAWSTTLPDDAGKSARTIFFKTESGPREVELIGIAESPNVIAAAVSYLLRVKADRVDVRRSEPIVAIVFHQPCQADDPVCPQSLVRLETGSHEPPPRASFDHRFAPDHALEAALDLFVAETRDSSIEFNTDFPFEGRWSENHQAGLFRFSPDRPFRVVREGGWAGCLSLAALDWFELKNERLLGVWPEEPVELDSGTVEQCTPMSRRHWTLAAGPRSGGRATHLLHSTDKEGKLQLRTVPGSAPHTPREVWTTTHPVDPEIAAIVVERLPGRIGATDAIVAMTDETGASPASGMPMIVMEIAEGQVSDDGAADYRTRLLAFYRPAANKSPCALSGIDVVRPKSAAAKLSATHGRVVETLREWLVASDRQACEPVQSREYLLVDADGGTWQVWERVNASRTSAASRPAGLDRSDASAPRPIIFAQAETRMSDAVDALPPKEAETRYVELRQLPPEGQALRVWIDDRLYARDTRIAGNLEREILRTIVRLSARHDHAPQMPVIRLECVDENCLLLEGLWRFQVVHGLNLGEGNGTGPGRVVLLRGSDWREPDRGLASRLAEKEKSEEEVPIFDLRSSASGDVRLAVRDRGAQSGSRPVLHWDSSASTWQKLGDLAPLSTAGHDETKQFELPLEHAILDRLTATPRRFRLISLPDVALLSFDDELTDGLHLSESFLSDGSRGPDVLTDQPLDPAMNLAPLAGPIAFPDHALPARDRAIWLPGGEASGLAVSGPLLSFQSGQVKIHSIHAVEPKSGGEPLGLVFTETCSLPRKVARNVLPGYAIFAVTAKMACRTVGDGALLSDLQGPGRQLAGGEHYRAKLIGEAPLADTVAMKFADAAYHGIRSPRSPFPKLSTGVLDGHHYASHNTPGEGRVWQEKEGELRELGRFSGIDLSDGRHLALLRELGSESGDGSFNGYVKEYGGFVTLFVEKLHDTIVHGERAGATIRVALLDGVAPGEGPVDSSIAHMLNGEVPRSILASRGDAAVAFARSKDESLVEAFAYFKGGIVPFKQWPADLKSDQAASIASFLLDLLQDDRGFDHVFRHRNLLAVCRRATGGSPRSEFVLLDLSGGHRERRFEWDNLVCDDAGIHLEPIAALAADWPHGPDGQSVSRLLAYSTGGGTVGVLSGDNSPQAEVLSTIEQNRRNERCKVSLSWNHPARDRFTDWLSENGQCKWVLQTVSAIVADAGNRATLIEDTELWDLEPIWDDDHLALHDNAERLATWIGDESSLRRAECSALRYGELDGSPHQLPVFAASVPCFGLALAWKSEPLATRLQRTHGNRQRLSPEDLAWIARRFVEVDKKNAGYLLDVGDVHQLSYHLSANDKTLLFVWDTSDQAGCAAVLPRTGQNGHRMAAVRDLLRDPDQAWKWSGESFARVTWSGQKNSELTVLSRSRSEDCVEDFSNPATRDSRDSSAYEHYALAIGHRNSEWTEVALGEDPDGVLSLLESGDEAAFFAIFQQTGGQLQRRAISYRPQTGLRFAILRDKSLYHRLLLDSAPCGRLDLGRVDELLEMRAQRNGAFDLKKAWDALFQEVETQEFGSRWYEEVLTDDPRHALDQESEPC